MWIEVIEIGLFCVCLYLAYLGCKQDLSASPMKNIPRLQKKVTKVKQEPPCPNNNNITTTQPVGLPSYNEVVCST